MAKRKGMSRQQIDDEVCRVEESQGVNVLVEREKYLSVLHELKVLRFKVCRRHWDVETPRRKTRTAMEGNS